MARVKQTVLPGGPAIHGAHMGNPFVSLHGRRRALVTVAPELEHAETEICRICAAGGTAGSKAAVAQCQCEIHTGVTRKVFPDGHRAADSPAGRGVVTRAAFISS